MRELRTYTELQIKMIFNFVNFNLENSIDSFSKNILDRGLNKANVCAHSHPIGR